MNMKTYEHLVCYKGKEQNILKIHTHKFHKKAKYCHQFQTAKCTTCFRLRCSPGSHHSIYGIIVVKELSTAILKHIVTGYRILYWQLFSLNNLKISQYFLASTVSLRC